MKKLISLLTILYNFAAFAQTLPEPMPSLDKSENLFDHEQQFKAWLGRQPQGTKGWKWMARYENDLLRRVDADGQMPSSEVLLNNNKTLENLRQRSANARVKTPEWTPAGPYGDSNLFGIGRVNCIAFHPKDSLTFYLGFGQGGIWKTTNGGKSYLPLGDNLPILRVSGITLDPNNADIIYASLADFAYIGYDLYTADRKRNTYYGIGVWKSTDGGKTWKQTGLKNQLSEGINSITRTVWVNPKNSKEVLVVGTKGVFKSFDGGDSWSAKVLDKITSALVQHPTNSNILFASGVYVATIKQGEAGIWKSEDAGNTWKLVPTGINGTAVQRVEIAVSPTNPNLIYAITCDISNGFEGFYRSFDTGETWQKSTFKGNLLSTVYTAAGGQGFYDLCILVHPTKPQTVYVGGLILNETNDGGNSWKQATGYYTIHPDQHAFGYNPVNKTIYLCNDGGVYATKEIIASTTQNLSWTFVAKGINATSCYRLGVSEDGKKVITGAQDNNMFLTENGKPWTNEFGGDGMEGALINNYVYGSSQYGYISFFDQNDERKQEKQVFPTVSDAGEWTTPFVINKSKNQVIIAGGNVFKGGVGEDRNSMKPISNFKIFGTTKYPQLSSALAVSKTNSDNIYIAKKNTPLSKLPADLWHTSNNGEFWENITNNIYKDSYVTYLAVDDDFPDRVWATLSNFVEGEKVYYSSNGGKVWQNISYNLPNIPANTIVLQSNENSDILYVGMDIGVYYLVEGSQEWKPLMGNLPNVIVHELEINQTTKKLYAATFGRGVWTIDLLTNEASQNQSADFYSMKTELFPNNNKGVFTLKADFNAIERVQIIDIMGRVQYEENLSAKALKFGKKFNIIGLQSGLYFVRLTNGSQSKVIRMVVE